MTGYIKIISINSSSTAAATTNSSTLPAHESEIEDIAWYARRGKRNEEVPCEGTWRSPSRWYCKLEEIYLVDWRLY